MHFQLVDDVLMEILDYSYRSNQRLPDYQPLCSFSLVSKAWSYEAQKRLFSEVYLPSRKHSRLFARSIDPSKPRGFYLGSLVIKLRVAPKSGSGEIWTNLPSLDTLEVAGYLTRHIDHLPSLSITSLRAYKQISHYSEDDLFNLIPKLAPRLEFLSLPRGIKYLTSGIYAVARAGGPPGFSLYELSFSGPFRWLQWVLSSTKNTLTILDLHDSLREDQFEAILSAHGATLLSLRLSNAEEPLTDEASISLSHCIRLQEFRYLHLPSEATLDHLPLSTLEHLDLTLDLKKIKNTGLIALANWMKKSKLFIFTWNWQDSPKGHTCPGINRTIEVCIESGIELRCFMPPIGAWIGESEELEYAYIFPRPCYTSNQRRDLWSQVQSLSVSWEPSWV